MICGLIALQAAAQSTATRAKALYEKGDYEKVKPLAKKLLKQAPQNGNYNLWYGVSCLETGEPELAVKPLETAVKRRTTSGQWHLARAYDALYRYDEAVENLETYISELEKRKRDTAEAEEQLKRTRVKQRMLKGVEKVCVVDSFVVDKANFLNLYHLSPESGKLYFYGEFFGEETQGKGDIVYENELGNKAYYSEMCQDGTMGIFSINKELDTWSEGVLLPDNINNGQNSSYPYVMSDGTTIYYASDGASSIGGYDIFVTRYDTNSDSYLEPENVGMPFNSPYNDYMYAIDEFNDLGWFVSDRYQPEGKVCIYVFIPNESKQVYNYENTDRKQLIQLATLRTLSDTWKENNNELGDAKNRLANAMNIANQPRKDQNDERSDFTFIIDDQTNYHHLSDFRSQQAKEQYIRYARLKRDYKRQANRLEALRYEYTQRDKTGKGQLASTILTLEQEVHQLNERMEQCAILVRQLEKGRR